MNDTHDPRDPQTESQIRRALSARAEETRVSPDALDNIRSRTTTKPWVRPAAYAAVAAIVVALLVGVAVLTSPDDDAGPNDVANDTTLPPDPSTPPDPTAPSTTTTAPPTTDPGPAGPLPTALGEPLQIDPSRALGLWSNDDGLPAADAVAAFVAERYGLTDVEISPTTVELADGISDDGVEAFGVHRRGENGETLDSFAFTVVTHTPPDGTAAVRFVLSDEFEIYETVGVTSGLRITGQGRAFEGTATLEVQGTETLLAVGSIEFADFEAVVPLGEHCPCVVTITGATAFAGQVPDIVSYSVDPDVEITPATVTHSVFGVAEDDVLNVRSGPGVDNPVITFYRHDATDIEVTGDEEIVDAARWIEVQTEDARGWVHSQFLVAAPDVDDVPGLADRLVDDYLMELSSLDSELFDDVVDVGGIGVYADFPTPWTAVPRSGFADPRDWNPEGTGERCPDCTLTVEEFLGFDTAKWELAEYTVGSDLDPANPNHFFESGLPAGFHDRFVTGTVYIPEPNPDESLDWRRYTVVFDFDDGAPLIRGVWRWGWTP